MPVRNSLDIIEFLFEAAYQVEDKILVYPAVRFWPAILELSIIELLQRRS